MFCQMITLFVSTTVDFEIGEPKGACGFLMLARSTFHRATRTKHS